MLKIILGFWLVLLVGFLPSSFPAYGLEDTDKMIEQKRQELTAKETRLKNEEERIKKIEKETEAKVQKLAQLLTQIEEALKKLGEVRSERVEHLVKTFEAMAPEEAAERLSALEKSLAVQILFKMNSKKAGPILAVMEPKKVSELTEIYSKTEKKIPTK